MPENILYGFNLLKFIVLYHSTHTVLVKRMCIIHLYGLVFYKCQLGQGIYSAVQIFYSFANCFCLVILSITEKGVSTFPIMNVKLPISLFNFVKFYFRYFEIPLGTYVFMIAISF